MSPHHSKHTDAAPRRLVLDTNVLLDWLVFRNPGCLPLAEALASGRAVWCTTAAMHAELTHVLARGTLTAWRPDLVGIEEVCWRLARKVELSCPTPARPNLRCTDPDDQKFIDLAWQLGDASLLSRDRAVLKLAKRAREAGFSIHTPEAWSGFEARRTQVTAAPAPARSGAPPVGRSPRLSDSG